MELKEIEDEWEKDCKINEVMLAEESTNIPSLHHKYYKIFVRESIKLKKLEEQYHTLYKDTWAYYSGKGTTKQYKERPFNLKLMKTDYDRYINSDEFIIEHKLKVAYQRQKVDYIESILKQISNRQWLIKNIIDIRKFESGVF